ncbi:uncharacterized protein [Apostichopus japonicus]|uniref:uncharacterized protein n=1 Tax=Stichopus japonicus TaxID=307972 RepID=UPI003AB60431
MTHSKFLLIYPLILYVAAFTLWLIDNNFCEQLRAIRSQDCFSSLLGGTSLPPLQANHKQHLRSVRIVLLDSDNFRQKMVNANKLNHGIPVTHPASYVTQG